MSETPSETRLRGSLLKKPTSPETTIDRLRGSLLESRAATEMGSTAVSRLRGSLLDMAPELTAAEPSLIPEGYDMPENVTELIADRNKKLTHTDDPENIVTTGMVLVNPTDPDSRRLVTGLFETPRGTTIANVHIEGQPALRNMALDELRQRIISGELLPTDKE